MQNNSSEPNYYDLTDSQNDINSLRIRKIDHYNCVLENSHTREAYRGFVLAKTKEGKRQTLCDIDFQRSTKENNKYQPRLTFRKVHANFDQVNLQNSATAVRIPFDSTQDGRVEFWNMVAFLHKFKEVVDLEGFGGTYHAVTSDEFAKFMDDANNTEVVRQIIEDQDIDISELLQLRPILNIKVLRQLRESINDFVANGATESQVQAWIDEGKKKYRQQRCLIFGLEYMDFKREGLLSSKKLDILTRVGSSGVDYALIELKGPCDDIFDNRVTPTNNNKSSSYKIHPSLARAIPQILEYKHLLENKPADDADLERLGIINKATIRKCIIVIGRNNDDPVWRMHRNNLSDALGSGLEVLTYTDLVDKLDATIENLEMIRGSVSANSTVEVEFDDVPF